MSGIIAAVSPDIFTPWSDRNLVYDLQPDEGLQVYRDGNRTLRLADPPDGIEAARKYRLTVSGDDLWAFALDGVWVGSLFTVDLAITQWRHLAPAATVVTLGRDPVPGSVMARTKTGADLEVINVAGRTVTVAAHPGIAAYVGYRPRLAMLLAEPWSVRFERNAFVTAKSLIFREV